MTIRASVPSALTTYSDVRPPCLTENAMRRPSRRIPGAPMTRASAALQSSVDAPACSFQMLSLAPFEETYSRYPGPSLGDLPSPVVRGIRRAADISARVPAIGTRQSVRFGLARVATMRRPSALAASEV